MITWVYWGNPDIFFRLLIVKTKLWLFWFSSKSLLQNSTITLSRYVRYPTHRHHLVYFDCNGYNNANTLFNTPPTTYSNILILFMLCSLPIAHLKTARVSGAKIERLHFISTRDLSIYELDGLLHFSVGGGLLIVSYKRCASSWNSRSYKYFFHTLSLYFQHPTFFPANL